MLCSLVHPIGLCILVREASNRMGKRYAFIYMDWWRGHLSIMLNAYLTCDSYDLPLKKRKRKSDSYAPPGTMLTWIVTRALWYFGGVAHVDYIINPTRIPVHKRGHKKCQNSETKFKIKANTTHQSIRHLYLSLSLSRSLSLSIIRAVQCSAVQRSAAWEMRKRTVYVWVVAIVCFVVLMIVTPAIPQNEAYHDFADTREFFGTVLFFRVPNSSSISSSSLFIYLYNIW